MKDSGLLLGVRRLIMSFNLWQFLSSSLHWAIRYLGFVVVLRKDETLISLEYFYAHSFLVTPLGIIDSDIVWFLYYNFVFLMKSLYCMSTLPHTELISIVCVSPLSFGFGFYFCCWFLILLLILILVSAVEVWFLFLLLDLSLGFAIEFLITISDYWILGHQFCIMEFLRWTWMCSWFSILQIFKICLSMNI